MNLRDQLKSSTAQSHDRLDRELRNFDPFVDQRHYRIFLMLMLNLHQRCSDSIAYVESQVDLPARKISLEELIRSDLQSLNHSGSIANCDSQPRQSQGNLDGASHKSAESMWGEAYVMEGSAMGGEMMFRQAESALPVGLGRSYLRQLSLDAGERWRAFVLALKSIEASGLDADKVVIAAGNMFDDAYSIFLTLKS